MTSKTIKKDIIAGSPLIMEEGRNSSYLIFRWETVVFAVANLKNEGCVVKPEGCVVKPFPTMKEYKEMDLKDLSRAFETLDEAFSHFSRYIENHLGFRNFLKQRHEEDKIAWQIHQEDVKAEEKKEYHVERKDITADDNLYYSDLISTRLKTILKKLDVYTLRVSNQTK